MFCEQCGSKVPEGAKFCPKCGSPAPQDDENIEVQNGGTEEHVENVEEPIIKHEKAETKKQKKSSKVGKIVIASVLGIALVCGGVGVTIKVVQDKNSPNVKASEKTAVKKATNKNIISDEEISDSEGRLQDEEWYTTTQDFFGLVLCVPPRLDSFDYTKIVGREEEKYYEQDSTGYNAGREYYVPFTVHNEMNNGVEQEYTIMSVSVYNVERDKSFEKKELDWMEDAKSILGSPDFLKETNDFYCFYDTSGGMSSDQYGDHGDNIEIYLCVKNEPLYYQISVGDLLYLNEGHLRGDVTDDAYMTTDIEAGEERVRKVKSSTGFEPFFTKKRLEDFVNVCEYTGYKSIYKE